MSLVMFLRTTVISMPIFTLLVGIVLHEPYLIALPFGLVTSDVINIVLKLFFSQFSYAGFFRPPGSKGCSLGCQDEIASGDPGFPSGHSQNAWFFASFMLLYYQLKSKDTGVKKSFVTGIYLIGAFLISYSRLGYYSILGTLCHTPFQVYVGSGLGIFLGWSYFQLVKKYLT